MSGLLRPCDCETGFCNHLPNPFKGHICRQDETEMAEEFSKALDALETAQAEITRLRIAKIHELAGEDWFPKQHWVVTFDRPDGTHLCMFRFNALSHLTWYPPTPDAYPEPPWILTVAPDE